jgi:hypothetical protein
MLRNPTIVFSPIENVLSTLSAAVSACGIAAGCDRDQSRFVRILVVALSPQMRKEAIRTFRIRFEMLSVGRGLRGRAGGEESFQGFECLKIRKRSLKHRLENGAIAGEAALHRFQCGNDVAAVVTHSLWSL